MIQPSRLAATGHWCRGLTILVLIAWVLGGCAQLPDTSGYTAATIQVKQAVAMTGSVASEELESAVAAGATTATKESVKKFDDAWAQTVESLDAMVAYAQSIEQIVDAGNKGAESAKQVADSVKRLVDAVKVDPRSAAGGKMIELSADTVAFVYGQYSKFVASKSLEEALDRFGPSMAKITTLVEGQISDARRLFIEQIEAQVQQLQSGGSGYGTWIKKKNELDKTAETAVSALILSIGRNKPAEIAQAKAMISDVEVARKQIAPRMAEYEANPTSRIQLGFKKVS